MVTHSTIEASGLEDLARRLDAYLERQQVPARYKHDDQDALTPSRIDAEMRLQGHPLRHLSYAVTDGGAVAADATRQIPGTSSGGQERSTLNVTLSYQYTPGSGREDHFLAIGFADWLRGRLVDSESWTHQNELLHADRLTRTPITPDIDHGGFFTFRFTLVFTLPVGSR